MTTLPFDFQEPPFSPTADPQFFYPAAAAQHVYTQLRTGGIPQRITVLTGEAGTGKTLLLRKLAREWPGPVRYCSLVQPPTVDEVLGLLGDTGAAISAAAQPSPPALLLLDEAQLLDPHVLARLLAFLRSKAAGERRLHAILAGPPGLLENVYPLSGLSADPHFLTVCTLWPLKPAEVEPFIRFRLSVAAAPDAEIFDPAAAARVAEYSQGVPQLINLLCDTALRIARLEGRAVVSPGAVDAAAHALQLGDDTGGSRAVAADAPPWGGPVDTPFWSSPFRVFRSHRKMLTWLGVDALVLLLFFSWGKTPPLAPTLESSSAPPASAALVEVDPAAEGQLSGLETVLLSPPASPSPQAESIAAPGRRAPDAETRQGRASHPSPPLDLQPSLVHLEGTLHEEPASGAPPKTSPLLQKAVVVDESQSEPVDALVAPPSREPVTLARSISGGEDVVLARSAPVGKVEKPRAGSRKQPAPPRRARSAGERALLSASQGGNFSAVERLLRQGTSPNVRDEYGWTPLMLAATGGHVAVVQALLLANADVEARNMLGGTALMVAAIHNHRTTAGALIGGGVNVNTKNPEGWTALMYAAWYGNTPVVQLLVDHGADVTIKDKNGRTALQHASWKALGGKPPAIGRHSPQRPRQKRQGEQVAGASYNDVVSILEKARARP